MPEYNGALLTTSVDPTSTAASTEEVNAALKAKLPSSLEILNSSPAEDKDSITVTQATAAKYHLTSISDLSPYAKDFVIGGPPEFPTRADGIPGIGLEIPDESASGVVVCDPGGLVQFQP